MGQASDCFSAFTGADVHSTPWSDDGSGGAQWVREEHSGCLAAESVPAHRGTAAAGWEAHLRVRTLLPASTGGWWWSEGVR